MNDKFDVVVVGAGPAGSTAARFAAMEGASVLLLDKRKEIGVPVQCGEFIPSAKELKDMLPKAPAIDELFTLDEQLVQRRTKKIIIVSPKGREYEFDFDGFTVNRDEFDRRLSELAVKEGAKVLTNAKFTGLVQGGVGTTKGDFKSRVIIAADGPFSNVCKSAAMETAVTVSPALTCQAKGEFGDGVRMCFGKEVAPGGYAWIIPKNGRANVGLGAQKSDVPLHRLLKIFLKENNLRTNHVNVGFIPMSGPIPETVKGNVMAVGDAAGQVMASNGGGIPTAMLCGRLAGIAAGKHIVKGDALSAYEDAWRSAIGKELETALKTKRLADRFFKYDFMLEFAMKRLGVKGLEKAIRCRKVFGK